MEKQIFVLSSYYMSMVQGEKRDGETHAKGNMVAGLGKSIFTIK